MVVKEPEVKLLFQKSVERFRIGDKAQLTMAGAPETQRILMDISAYYVKAIGTLRLFVGSESGRWSAPMSVDPNNDYEAINLALAETDAIQQELPDFESPEAAVAAWKDKMRGRAD